MIELSPIQVCALLNKKVYVKSSVLEDINNKTMICDGSRKIDGINYIILDDEQYSYILFVEGKIRVFID